MAPGAAAGALKPAIARANCDVDADLPRALPADARPRMSDWVLTGLVLGENGLPRIHEAAFALRQNPVSVDRIN